MVPAPEPRFLLDLQQVDDRTCLVTAAGELHMSTAPRLGAHLRDAMRSGYDRVVVDLSHVQFIDSTGLGVLLSGLRELQRRGGRLVVVASNPTVLRLFAITGTDTTLGVQASRQAGLAAVTAEHEPA